MTHKKSFRLNQRGQSVIEYLIIVSIMAVGSIAIVRTVSDATKYNFAKIAEGLGATPSTSLDKPEILESATKKRDMSDFMTGALKPGKK